jgi:hypothetical protein
MIRLFCDACGSPCEGAGGKRYEHVLGEFGIELVLIVGAQARGDAHVCDSCLLKMLFTICKSRPMTGLSQRLATLQDREALCVHREQSAAARERGAEAKEALAMAREAAADARLQEAEALRLSLADDARVYVARITELEADLARAKRAEAARIAAGAALGNQPTRRH